MSKSLRFACVLVNLFVVLATAARNERTSREEVISPENFKNGIQHTFSAVNQLVENFQTIYDMVLKGPCDEGMKAHWINIDDFLKDTLKTMIVSFQKSWSNITIDELGIKDFTLEFRDGSKLKTLNFERIVLSGLDNVNVKTYDMDFCSLSYETEIVFPKLQLTAMYELDGYVNKKGPISGVGNLTINIDALSIHSLACGYTKSLPSSSKSIPCNSMKTQPKSVTVNIPGITFMNLTDEEFNEIVNRKIADLLQSKRETQPNVTEQNARMKPRFKSPISYLQYNNRVI